MMAKRQIATEWGFSVQVDRGTGDFTCIVSGGEDDLNNAMAEAFRYATYYMGVCGYATRVYLDERCTACDGSGEVAYKRGSGRAPWMRKACPACKGKFEGQKIGPVPVVCHNQVTMGEKGTVNPVDPDTEYHREKTAETEEESTDAIAPSVNDLMRQIGEDV